MKRLDCFSQMNLYGLSIEISSIYLFTVLEESGASVKNAIEMVTLLAYSLNCIHQDVQQYATIELSAQDSKWLKKTSLLKRTSSESAGKKHLHHISMKCPFPEGCCRIQTIYMNLRSQICM